MNRYFTYSIVLSIVTYCYFWSIYTLQLLHFHACYKYISIKVMILWVVVSVMLHYSIEDKAIMLLPGVESLPMLILLSCRFTSSS